MVYNTAYFSFFLFFRCCLFSSLFSPQLCLFSSPPPKIFLPKNQLLFLKESFLPGRGFAGNMVGWNWGAWGCEGKEMRTGGTTSLPPLKKTTPPPSPRAPSLPDLRSWDFQPRRGAGALEYLRHIGAFRGSQRRPLRGLPGWGNSPSFLA